MQEEGNFAGQILPVSRKREWTYKNYYYYYYSKNTLQQTVVIQ
jgi:hypothetical protein